MFSLRPPTEVKKRSLERIKVFGGKQDRGNPPSGLPLSMNIQGTSLDTKGNCTVGQQSDNEVFLFGKKKRSQLMPKTITLPGGFTEWCLSGASRTLGVTIKTKITKREKKVKIRTPFHHTKGRK